MISVSNKLCKIEQEYNLFDLEVNNIKIYQHTRLYIYHSLLLPALGIFSPPAIFPKYRNIANNMFSYLLHSIKHNEFYGLKKCEYLLIGSKRLEFINSNYIDIYNDYYLEYLKNVTLLKRPYRGITNFYKFGNNDKVYEDYFNIKAKILPYFYSKTNQQIEKIAKDLTDILNRCFDVKISLIKLRNYFLSINYKIITARVLVKQVHPKVIITNSWAGATPYIQAAKELKIPVIEIQHGPTYPGQITYDYPNSFNTDISIFPDYVFLFGDFWKKNITFPIKQENVISVGFPHFESFKKNVSPQRVKNQIIVLSQNVLGRKLFDLSIYLSKKLPSFRVIYKLHPKQYFNWKKELLDKIGDIPENLIFADEDSKPLYHYLAKSEYQIGVFSTALFEGIGFGLKTIICKLPGWENVKEIINNNYAVLAEKDDIPSLIQNGKLKELDIDSEKFFKNNSINNILSNIQKISNVKI